MALEINGVTIGSKKELELGLGKVSDKHWKNVDDLESKRNAAERKYRTKFLQKVEIEGEVDFVPIPQKVVSNMYKSQDDFKKIGNKLKLNEWEIQDSNEKGMSKEEFLERKSSIRTNSIGEKR